MTVKKIGGSDYLLPDPDTKAADIKKPVKVFILLGQSNMSDPTSDNRRTKYMPSNHWTLAQKNKASADKAHCLNHVGSYQANAFGLKDMHGNVAEWTRSEMRRYPYSASNGRNALRTGRKIVRGGSWNDRPVRSTSSYRLSYPSWQRVYNVGFRIIIQ